MKLSMQASTWTKAMETGQEADFSAFESKIDPTVLAEVKSIFETELANAQSDPTNAEMIDAVQKEWMAACNGPDGESFVHNLHIAARRLVIDAA